MGPSRRAPRVLRCCGGSAGSSSGGRRRAPAGHLWEPQPWPRWWSWGSRASSAWSTPVSSFDTSGPTPSLSTVCWPPSPPSCPSPTWASARSSSTRWRARPTRPTTRPCGARSPPPSACCSAPPWSLVPSASSSCCWVPGPGCWGASSWRAADSLPPSASSSTPRPCRCPWGSGSSSAWGAPPPRSSARGSSPRPCPASCCWPSSPAWGAATPCPSTPTSPTPWSRSSASSSPGVPPAPCSRVP